MEQHGGKVKYVSFVSGPVSRQFSHPGEDTVKEFIKGDGLRWEKGRIGNIFSQSVDKQVMQAVRTNKVWYPGFHM